MSSSGSNIQANHQSCAAFLLMSQASSNFLLRKTPPQVTDRSRFVTLLIHGFSNTAKGGLGASFDFGRSVKFRVETWRSDSENESSNWREYTNIVESLKEEVVVGSIKDSTILMATDNSTVGIDFYKCKSSNVKIYVLIVRVRSLKLKQVVRLFVTHVSGERMRV